MRLSICAVLTASLGFALSAEVGAQGADATELRGRVFEASDSSISLAGVDVELPDIGLRARTDVSGHYAITPALRGTFAIRVRRIGYEAYEGRVTVDSGRSNRFDIALRRSGQQLATVEIHGKRVMVPARFEQVYARGASGRGVFFTREDIEARNPQDVKALLSTIMGVQVNQRGLTFQKCQSGLPLSNEEMFVRRQGHVQVYVDGKRVTRNRSGGSSDPISGDDADAAVRLVPPTQIQAMEVYTGLSRIPAEFSDDACAVIAIWTKVY